MKFNKLSLPKTGQYADSGQDSFELRTSKFLKDIQVNLTGTITNSHATQAASLVSNDGKLKLIKRVELVSQAKGTICDSLARDLYYANLWLTGFTESLTFPSSISANGGTGAVVANITIPFYLLWADKRNRFLSLYNGLKNGTLSIRLTYGALTDVYSGGTLAMTTTASTTRINYTEAQLTPQEAGVFGKVLQVLRGNRKISLNTTPTQIDLVSDIPYQLILNYVESTTPALANNLSITVDQQVKQGSDYLLALHGDMWQAQLPGIYQQTTTGIYVFNADEHQHGNLILPTNLILSEVLTAQNSTDTVQVFALGVVPQ